MTSRLHSLPDRPVQATPFEEYARRWLTVIPQTRRSLGHWMPHEGTNNIAYALISFDSLAATERIGRASRWTPRRRQFPLRAEERLFSAKRTFLRPL